MKQWRSATRLEHRSSTGSTKIQKQKSTKFIDYALALGSKSGTASEMSQEALQEIMHARSKEPYADVLSMMLL